MRRGVFGRKLIGGSGSWRDGARKYRIELNFEPLINLAFILCRVEELFEALKEFSARFECAKLS